MLFLINKKKIGSKKKKNVIYKNNVVFLWPLSTGDVRWHDGLIKEDEVNIMYIGTS